MKTIDSVSLETITGGAFKPVLDPTISTRIDLRDAKLLDAKAIDVGRAYLWGGLELPSKKLLNELRRERF